MVKLLHWLEHNAEMYDRIHEKYIKHLMDTKTFYYNVNRNTFNEHNKYKLIVKLR